MSEKIRVLKYLLILPGFLIIITCAKQEPEPIVARAGKTTIPLSEFRERYEFTPHIILTKDAQRNQRQVLISLLGEKILAEEAYHRKLTDNGKFQTYSEQMENEAIVEALFEKEVAAKIQISDKELRQAFLLSQAELDVQVLSFDNMQQAAEARRQIEAGKSLNQVKREFQTDTFIAADSVTRLTMKWGEAHPKLEEAAYRLKLNEVSAPVEADGISFIIKLLQRRTNVVITEGEYLKEAPLIRNKIKQRKWTQLFDEFMHSLMANKEVKVSQQVFYFVADELEKIYGIGDSLEYPEKRPEFFDNPWNSLKNKDLADHLNDPFARFKDKSIWTIGDFIKKLMIGPYPLNHKSREVFRKSLSAVIRRMIEFESMVKKGRDLGLENSAYVSYQTKMWTDAYLAQELQQEIADSVTVSDEEVQEYYKQHKNTYTGPELVNLQEILVDKEALAHDLYRRIKYGEDMGELAQKYNKRESDLKKDGVRGYIMTSALGPIGKAARNLKIGEIGGPVETEQNQFSVFKILDKKEARPLPVNEVWDRIKSDALADKQTKAVDHYLTQLAGKYEIKVNHTMVDTLTTTNIGMLVLKQHFPNRTAAPFVIPLNHCYEWQKLMYQILPLDRVQEF